jgi:ADP-heptose:LPS heptosyltransferase
VLRPRLHVPDVPRKLFVAAPTFLGDTLLMQPPLRMLRRAFPAADITVAARYPQMLHTADLDVRPWPDTSAGVKELARGAEVCFVPYYHFGDACAWRMHLSGRGVTFTRDVGFQRMQDYGIAALAEEKHFDSHEVHNLLNLFARWPLPGELPRFELSPTAEAMARVHQLFPALGETPYATVQLGSGQEMKNWPAERWGLLASEFQRQTGLRIVFIGPPDAVPDTDREIQRHRLNAINACTPFPADELVAIIAGARIAIGMCSGPKHIAIALRIPTFTLYGPTSPERWGALWDRERHAFLKSPVDYLTPAEHLGLPPNYQMLQIEPGDATSALMSHYTSLGLA